MNFGETILGLVCLFVCLFFLFECSTSSKVNIFLDVSCFKGTFPDAKVQKTFPKPLSS